MADGIRRICRVVMVEPTVPKSGPQEPLPIETKSPALMGGTRLLDPEDLPTRPGVERRPSRLRCAIFRHDQIGARSLGEAEVHPAVQREVRMHGDADETLLRSA